VDEPDISEQKSIGQILVEMGVLEEDKIHQAIAIQKERGGLLGQILIELGHISEEDLLQALATQYDLPTVMLDELEIPQEVIKMVSPDMAQMYQIVPYAYENGVLSVALADPRNVHALDDLRFMLNCRVEGAVAATTLLKELLNRFYGASSASMKDLLADFTKEDLAAVPELQGEASERDIEKIVNAPPVI